MDGGKWMTEDELNRNCWRFFFHGLSLGISIAALGIALMAVSR